MQDVYGVSDSNGCYLEVSTSLTYTKKWATAGGYSDVYVRHSCGHQTSLMASKINDKWVDLNSDHTKLYLVEVTDIHGGELNYSWVTRYKVHSFSMQGAMSKVSRRCGISFRGYDVSPSSAVYHSMSKCTGATIELTDLKTWQEDDEHDYIVL